MAKVTVAHISDLHVGSYYFSEPLLKQTIGELNRLKPNIVVVGGDLTNMGLWPEYGTVKTYLDQIECDRMMVVPGNHDSRNVGYVHFEDIFRRRHPIMEYKGVLLVGIDSSQPDLNDGRVGRQHYPWIARTFKPTSPYKIFVLHHHLVSVPGTGRERNIVHDAGDVLDVLVSSGVNMVLSGHKHVPHVWKLEDILVINAGTTSSLKLRGTTKPCYNIIEIEGKKARVFQKQPGGAKKRVA